MRSSVSASGGLRKISPLARRAAVGQERLGEAGKVAAACAFAGPAEGDDFGDGKAFAGVADGGGEHVRQRQLAEPAVQLGPAVDAAGHADRERAERRNVLRACACAILRQLCERRDAAAAAGVEAVELLRLGVPDDGEQVAAEAAAGGLGDAEDGVGGDGGVDGVAAGFEHVERDRVASGWLVAAMPCWR